MQGHDKTKAGKGVTPRGQTQIRPEMPFHLLWERAIGRNYKVGEGFLKS
jgi:hypothetical protein